MTELNQITLTFIQQTLSRFICGFYVRFQAEFKIEKYFTEK
ncbi:hypothetical protein THERMOT_2260 [Bathymodiolus thermophilus thioautotrophic gill symbiont]|uniref:Uncharacterized protein n=1 Tax=Bathymodiolus thermophilus thioautotrophic gill symbiont TaxID=2360 RepID=A0A8H8XEZ2_9GAMM|nr:hypothetical protein THERMOT_2260 [Bathymodiolus thermophilus thioautotrophic gill symbiont]CAB5506090.1 hypothetical protein THERMOS_2237 [Bathymodiolus thermophilus thioautotrophic gill symbiont]